MIARLTVAFTRLITGAQAVWLGCEPRPGPRVYFANHASHMDALLIWSSLPKPLRARTRPVASKRYWESSRLRRFFALRAFNALLIHQTGITRATNPLDDMLAALEAGESLIIFPEGTRNPGDEVGPFAAGIYHLARRRPEVELIPAYLRNLNRVLPKGEFLPVPVLASVFFGAPMRLTPDESRAAFLDRAREAVVDLGRSS
jgi:1-acyl-sn-glycerol-3-phosphate acyltransferase